MTSQTASQGPLGNAARRPRDGGRQAHPTGFEHLPQFRVPQKIVKHSNLAQEGGGADCSEVYSPPRVTKLAGDIGLQAGRALDFTTMHGVGNLLDFNLPS